MRRTATVLLVAAAAGAAAMLAGCGVELSSNAATPPSSPAPSAPSSASPSPSSTATLTPPSSPALPSASPSPSPSASSSPSAAEAAARRRIETAALVQDVLPRFDPLVADMFRRSGVPGAAIAVVAGDRAVYVRCLGVRTAREEAAVDKDTLFQLGAVTKGLTTAMLAGLVTEDEIAWDEPVTHDWPGFRLWDGWVSRETTYRDLAAERTGLPRDAGEELLAFGYGRAEILRRLRYLEPSDGFRTSFEGQTAAFTAAAVAAEKAAGESWQTLVRTRILRPLGMDETALTFDRFRTAADRAAPHRLLAGVMQSQRPADRSVFAPESGAASSVADLIPYVRLQLNEGAVGGVRVASAAALQTTHTPAIVVSAGEEGTIAEALGWRSATYDGRVVLSADGDLARGSGAYVALAPDDGVGVVVLTNAYPQGGALGEAVAKTLLDLYTQGDQREDWLSVLLEERARRSQSAASRARRLPEAPPARARGPHGRVVYEGRYGNAYYGQITVTRDASGGLQVRLGRGETLRYVPWDGDTWCELASHTAAVFDVEDGHAVAVRLDALAGSGRSGTFRRR